MDFDDGEKAQIDLRCERIAERIIQCVLKEHTAMCPYGKTLLSVKWWVVGFVFGSGFLGGGAFFKFIL